MRPFYTLAAITLVALFAACAAARADDAKPAEAKEQPPLIGEVRTQTLKGFTYFYVATKTNFKNLGDKIGVLIPEVRKGAIDSHAQVSGPLVFIYHNVTEDQNADFDLEIGFPVEEKVTPAGNCKVRDVPEYSCLGLLFTGSMPQIHSAYEKLMPAVMGGAAKPTGEIREMVLYFEGPESPNNIAHVSAGLK